MDLELVTAALSKVTAALDADIQNASLGGSELSANENDAQQLCHECLNIVQQLSDSLSSLQRVKGNPLHGSSRNGKWESLRRPFKLSGPRMRLNRCASDWMDIDNN